jgi:hypothetical protein
MLTGVFWEIQEETDHYEDIDLGGKIIVKWFLQKYCGLIWTGLIWLKIGTSGGLL